MRRATFWFIFGTVLLDMLALGIIAPVLPKLVIQLEGGNEASAAGLFGLFGTVWAAMQFLFAPVLGSGVWPAWMVRVPKRCFFESLINSSACGGD